MRVRIMGYGDLCVIVRKSEYGDEGHSAELVTIYDDHDYDYVAECTKDPLYLWHKFIDLRNTESSGSVEHMPLLQVQEAIAQQLAITDND